MERYLSSPAFLKRIISSMDSTHRDKQHAEALAKNVCGECKEEYPEQEQDPNFEFDQEDKKYARLKFKSPFSSTVASGKSIRQRKQFKQKYR